MGTETINNNNNIICKDDRTSPDYLAQLLKDKKQIQAFPNVFSHAERLLDEEINKVRDALFHFNTNKEMLSLPTAEGQIVTMQEKVFVPVKEYPDFNFVGRILGPRGMTAKQLEQDTGCKIMVRGKGSMRDKQKEEMNRGKPNWEHLNEELHVLITVEDTKNRCEVKLKRATDEVRKLLVPAPEGEDELKKMQLMELAIINGTYRDNVKQAGFILPGGLMSPLTAEQMQQYFQGASMAVAPSHMKMTAELQRITAEGPRLIAPQMALAQQMRSPTGQIFISPRMQTIQTSTGMVNGGPPPLVSPTDSSLFYPYATEYPYGLQGLHPATLLEYAANMENNPGGLPKVRRTVAGGIREHPYQRVTSL